MDRWLKLGTTTTKESNTYSSNQLTGNNEIKDESTSILKEPVKKEAKSYHFITWPILVTSARSNHNATTSQHINLHSSLLKER
ncbi:hypothetical protein TNIN_243301 [Trichonephila inaurata madagascariensis]|uniref:Uncharacterized protein n=1 Tax=Trichonephila inaurata madagascariensis TaxID=2747483 RepID=A0A8X6XH08_9ARAC|nr:hypothetical protein TNIN_243301 [Trichonephila inaurata madagascariensis]